MNCNIKCEEIDVKPEEDPLSITEIKTDPKDIKTELKTEAEECDIKHETLPIYNFVPCAKTISEDIKRNLKTDVEECDIKHETHPIYDIGASVKTITEIVGKYKRKTNKGNWSSEELQEAIRAIQDGKSIRSVSKSTGISFSTLQERISKQQFNAPKLGKKAIFTPDQEAAMCSQLIKLANLFYGLTPNDVKRAAFEFAEANQIEHPFSKDTRMAGRYWLEGFIKRNPLSLRKSVAMSISRIKGFNKDEVSRFYGNLEDVYSKYNFLPTNIYNVNETGIGTVQEPKGQKRVEAATSAERGIHTTVICAMNAAGNYIPPMFIFARMRMSPSLEKDGPPGALYTCSKNGWSNEELFLKWLKHFAATTHPTPEIPTLLILDNHYSHCTLESYEFCKANGILMVSLPPHTSHRTQPLDVSFFGPLKSAFNKECETYMKINKFKSIRPDDLASLFKKAYASVATIANALSGFEATGIFPFNANIFSDGDYYNPNLLPSSSQCNLPSQSNNPNPLPASSQCNLPSQPNNPNPLPSSSQCSLPSQSNNPNPLPASSQCNLPNLSRISCSTDVSVSSQNNVAHESTSHPTANELTAEEPADQDKGNDVQTSIATILNKISPGPSVHGSRKSRRTRKQHSEILTALPMKAEFEAKKSKIASQKEENKDRPKPKRSAPKKTIS